MSQAIVLPPEVGLPGLAIIAGTVRRFLDQFDEGLDHEGWSSKAQHCDSPFDSAGEWINNAYANLYKVHRTVYSGCWIITVSRKVVAPLRACGCPQIGQPDAHRYDCHVGVRG